MARSRVPEESAFAGIRISDADEIVRKMKMPFGTKPCKYCKSEILMKVSRDLIRKNFCSRGCRQKWRFENGEFVWWKEARMKCNTPEANFKKSYARYGLFKNCEHCGEAFLKTSRNARWCSACVPDRSARSIMQRYGLSIDEHKSLVQKVNGICPICQRRPASVVDHCHKTNTVRGAICQRCNNVLAYLEERNVLARALQYLEVHSNSIRER